MTGGKGTELMRVVLYTNGNQESERAKSLFESLNSKILEYKLNNHFSQKSFESEFGENAEYQQISIGYAHIGSLKDTLKFLEKNGVFVV